VEGNSQVWVAGGKYTRGSDKESGRERTWESPREERGTVLRRKRSKTNNERGQRMDHVSVNREVMRRTAL
jgi:hypothetical protein